MENLLARFMNGIRIKNSQSNLHLHIEEIKSSENKAIYKLRTDISPKNTIWTLKEAGNEYFYISSNSENGTPLYLTCVENNIVEPKEFTGEDNQKFYLHHKQKDEYVIKVKAAKNKFGIELKNNRIGMDDKVEIGAVNGTKEQNWIFEAIEKEKKSKKLKAVNNPINEKIGKVTKTVIYKDDELIHTVVYVK